MSSFLQRLPKTGGSELWAGLLGLFLGVALLKFGNPPILENWVQAPTSLWEALSSGPWPISWAYWGLALVVGTGVWTMRGAGDGKPVLVLDPWGRVWAWLPLAWLAWQALAMVTTVNVALSLSCLKHFAACVVCFYLGFWGLNRVRSAGWFWGGVFAGCAVMLAVGWQQRFGGLEQTRRFFYLYIYPFQSVSPEYLKKISSNRIYSTLFYPNALAGALLLLMPILPVALRALQKCLGQSSSRMQLWMVGGCVLGSLCLGASGLERGWEVVLGLGLVLLLPLFGWSGFLWASWAAVLAAGLPCLFWSGSKGGWILALLLAVGVLLQLPFSRRLKLGLVLGVLLVGLTGLGLRHYAFFQRGATSVGARYDCWQAAVRSTMTHPLLGTGPGTFGEVYQRLRKPEAEPSRLVHNDYLEQASDSGIPGFILFGLFVAGTLFFCLKEQVFGSRMGLSGVKTDQLTEASKASVRWLAFWKLEGNWPKFLVWMALLGWFLHNFIEFGLFIPSSAWLAFTLLGWLRGGGANLVDKTGATS